MKLWEIYNSTFEDLTEEELNSEYMQNHLINLEYFNRMFIPEEFKFNSDLNNFILDYDAGTTSKSKIGTYVAGVIFGIHPKKNSITIYTDKIKTGKEDVMSSIPNRFPDKYDEMTFLGFKTKEALNDFVIALKTTFGGDNEIIPKEGIPT